MAEIKMNNSDVQKLLTIIITTKDRYDDLNYTLARLLDLGLGDLPIIIFDDASKNKIADPSLIGKFTNMHISRNDTSKGLIVNRNLMTKIAKTPFVCSLDDDSCFSDVPDLLRALNYLVGHKNVVALELNNADVNQGKTHRPSDLKTYHCQTYTGCGHIINRELFLQMGGYREYLVHMCEERDFSLRAWRCGYLVERYDMIRVDHQKSAVARSSTRNMYFLVRNTVILSYMNFPLFMFFYRMLLIIPFQLWLQRGAPSVWGSIFKGWVDGLICIMAHRTERRALSLRMYRYVMSLPT